MEKKPLIIKKIEAKTGAEAIKKIPIQNNFFINLVISHYELINFLVGI